MTASLTRRRALGLLAMGGAASLAACARTPSTEAGAATAAAAAPQGGTVTARGTFTGASNHVTRGHARIVFAGGKVFVELEDDFFFDGAPDPKVGLGRGGFDPDTLLAPLASNTGAQAYTLKPGLDIADYDEVWIWCERFSVPLGVAKLQLV